MKKVKTLQLWFPIGSGIETHIVQMINSYSHLYALAKHIASQIPLVSSIGYWAADTDDGDSRKN